MRERLQEKQNRALKASQVDYEKAMKKRKEMVTELCLSPAAVDFLKMIYDSSGYSKHLLMTSSVSGEVNTSAMVYREGRRSLYTDLRQFLPKGILKKVEGE